MHTQKSAAVCGTSMITGIEHEYRLRMDSLSPKERVARSVALFNWARELIGRQIVAERGPLSPERLKWEVALRQYGGDSVVRRMIERKLSDVSC
ncbi:MAG: hypothetical protein ACE5KM_02275 [Planctomycetaceae bacterium]